jgi:hypothetical protein
MPVMKQRHGPAVFASGLVLLNPRETFTQYHDLARAGNDVKNFDRLVDQRLLQRSSSKRLSPSLVDG